MKERKMKLKEKFITKETDGEWSMAAACSANFARIVRSMGALYEE